MNSTTSKVGRMTRREFVKGSGAAGLVVGAGGAALLEPARSMPQQVLNGKTIREPARDIKVCREADVVVVGGGREALVQPWQLHEQERILSFWKGMGI